MSSINFESEIIDDSAIEREMNENWEINSQMVPFDIDGSLTSLIDKETESEKIKIREL